MLFIETVLYSRIPHILYWVEVQGFIGYMPPENSILSKEFINMVATVFGVIVLLDMVSIKKALIKKWQ